MLWITISREILSSLLSLLSDIVHTRRWKFIELSQRCTEYGNPIWSAQWCGLSRMTLVSAYILCCLSIYYVVATSKDETKSKESKY